MLPVRRWWLRGIGDLVDRRTQQARFVPASGKVAFLDALVDPAGDRLFESVYGGSCVPGEADLLEKVVVNFAEYAFEVFDYPALTFD